MAAKGQRRPRLGPKKALSIASSLLFIIAAAVVSGAVFAPRCAEAKSTSSPAATRSRVAYREPTPAEGGKVVHYNLTLGVAKRAPDCYREFFFGGGGSVLFLSFFSSPCGFSVSFFLLNLFPPKNPGKKSKVRDVYTINGQFGGPTIEVHRGDVLHVTLVNEVPADYPQVRGEKREEERR